MDAQQAIEKDQVSHGNLILSLVRLLGAGYF